MGKTTRSSGEGNPVVKKAKMGLATQGDYIACEDAHGAHNYHPLPVVLERGEGCYVWDIDGKRYLDFLAAYSALNQGHCHPRLVKVMQDQCAKLALTSRAFHNDIMAPFTKFITEFFGYDKVLPMNTGVEGGETAVKAIRKWGYMVKGIPSNQAKVIFMSENFWGRSIAACSSSSDPDCFTNYGPFTPGFVLVPYGNYDALAKELEDPNVAGVYLEVIQGEAGVKIPPTGYIQKLADLCKQKRVLTCFDEIQTGCGRTGKLLACDWEGVRPDILVLAKSLSGGMYPVSCVLANNDVMNVFAPGTHGSTYGGNPLACALAMEALAIVKEEKLSENADKMGELFRSELAKFCSGFKWIKEIRGRGLMNAVEWSDAVKISALDGCVKLKDAGLIAKPTHNTIIRFSPPLTITREQVMDAVAIIKKVFTEIDAMQK